LVPTAFGGALCTNREDVSVDQIWIVKLFAAYACATPIPAIADETHSALNRTRGAQRRRFIWAKVAVWLARRAATKAAL
jgi:hypothetical protein